MNPASRRLEELQDRDRELKARLTQLGEMRPGSLVERFRKCGKPNCHCARRGDRGHGPMWMVTHAVKGKTVSKAIPSGPAVEATRSQIAEYQRFRGLARELVVTNEQICDARLEGSRGPSASENKKDGVGGEHGRRGGAGDRGSARRRSLPEPTKLEIQ